MIESIQLPIIGSMELLLIILLLVVGPLAVLVGPDSRNTDTRVKQRWI